MLPGVLIGAIYEPGFSADLSHWRLVIDDAGELYQDVHIATPAKSYADERRQEHVAIGQTAVLDLLLLAERLGFATFAAQPEVLVDDAPTYIVYIGFARLDKIVMKRGPLACTPEDFPQWHDFSTLWDAIHAAAPFPTKR